MKNFELSYEESLSVWILLFRKPLGILIKIQTMVTPKIEIVFNLIHYMYVLNIL